MALKKNTVANYVGQGYTLAVGILVMPIYMQFMGAEAYGLVGFFSLLQSWMILLDMGLSPTLARQVAYAKGRENGFIFFNRLLKSFEFIFFITSACVVTVIVFTSDVIATDWINAQTLNTKTVTDCVALMGLSVGVRFCSALYRSGVAGNEDQVWLNMANVVMSSLRFLGGALILKFFSGNVVVFFQYQVIVSCVELLTLATRVYKTIPEVNCFAIASMFDFRAVKSVAPFSLGIAYTTAIWILITQADKLILSKVLSLEEFGYLSLVVVVAGAVSAIASPIYQAFMPRMTLFVAEGNNTELRRIYRQGSQVITLVACLASVLLALYGEELLRIWTGNIKASRWSADVLTWFALGNGVLAISAFQYYLQSAFGTLKLHVVGSTVSVFLQVPIIYWAASSFGAPGAGLAWFTCRFLWFLVWTPIVHYQFLPRFHWKWLVCDIAPIVAAVAVSSIAFYIFTSSIDFEGAWVLMRVFLSAVFTMAVMGAFFTQIRNEIKKMTGNNAGA